MSNELQYVKHPQKNHKRWAIFYIVLTIAVLAGLILWAQTLRSYRLPQGSISLRVPYSTYLVGEAITFSLTNHYNTTVYIPNHCPSEPLAVYRLESGKWKRLHATTNEKNCSSTDRTVAIEPGQTQNGNYIKWPSLFRTPGTYRIAAMVDYFGTVSYQDFKIISKPEPKVVTKVVPGTSTSGSSQTSTTQSSGQSGSTGGGTGTGGGTVEEELPQKTITTSRGSMTVAYSATTVYVLSIQPSSGCIYEGGQSGSFVETTFKCGGETQIQLWLSNGNLIQKIE